MLASVAEWFRRRTTAASSYSPTVLASLKAAQGTRVSVVLPARNEAETVGAIVTELRRLTVSGLIDQILVVDSGSTDETGSVAARAGAEVVRQAEVLPRPGQVTLLHDGVEHGQQIEIKPAPVHPTRSLSRLALKPIVGA